MSTPDSKYTDLVSAFGTKTRPVFMGNQKATKGPKILVINRNAIPCTPAGYGESKNRYVTFCIVKCLDVGFTQTPLTNTVNEKNEQCWKIESGAKYLSEKDIDDNEIMNCFPWQVETSPLNKGERVEEAKFSLKPGISLGTLFFRDPPSYQRGEKSSSLFPSGLSEIPEFQTCILHLSIKYWSDVKVDQVDKRGNKMKASPSVNGYGFGIDKIELSTASLYTFYQTVSSRFPVSLSAAKHQVNTIVQENNSIRSLANVSTPFFLISTVNEKAYISHSQGAEDGADQIIVANWGSSDNDPPLLLPIAPALKYTNMRTTTDLIFLLDLCIAAKAVKFLVVGVDNSRFSAAEDILTGIPIIDVSKLLSSISFDETRLDLADTLVFKTGVQLVSGVDAESREEIKQEVVIEVSTTPELGIPGTLLPSCRDLCIVSSTQVQLEKAYRMDFKFADCAGVLFTCFYDSTPPSTAPQESIMTKASMAVGKRKFYGGGSGPSGPSKKPVKSV